MHEQEAVFSQVLGRFRLYTDVEEADAVVELLARADGLAAHGGEGAVVGGRVVRAGDGEGRERSVVAEFLHPAREVGGGEEGEVGILRQEDGGVVEAGIWCQRGQFC